MPGIFENIAQRLFGAKVGEPVRRDPTFDRLSAAAQVKGRDPHTLEQSVPLMRDLDERILIATRCRDADVLPKVANAGAVVEGPDGISVQIMHNGVRVVAGGYYGDWMQQLIGLCHGHHEPQEEVLFAEVLKHLPVDAAMLELGGFWSFYSIWFQQGAPQRRAVVIEPDPAHLEIGRANARLNGCQPVFVNAFVGSECSPSAPFSTERSGQLELECVTVAELMERHGIERLDLLHCDAQGVELSVIESCAPLAMTGRLDWLIVSTHAEPISGDPLTHQRCLAALQAMGATILAEHDVHESFSGDGLIVAKFGTLPEKWRTPELSFNRYSESLFRNAVYDFALERQAGRRAAEQMTQLAASAPPAPPFDVTLLAGSGTFTRQGTLLTLCADGDFGPAGETLLMRHDHVMFPYVAVHGGWSREIVDFFVEHARPQRRYNVVDIGANVGLFSRQLAYRLINVDRFLCVEPEPDNFRALQYNLARMPGAKAELFNVALSASEGEATFFRDAQNVGNYSLADDAMRGRPFDSIPVRCVSTEAWMNNNLSGDARLLWKSDTQGYDELIISLTPMEVWSRIDAACIEVWRIRKPEFDQDAFLARIDDFPNKALGVGNRVNTADIVAYLDSDDSSFTDLFLWR